MGRRVLRFPVQGCCKLEELSLDSDQLTIDISVRPNGHATLQIHSPSDAGVGKGCVSQYKKITVTPEGEEDLVSVLTAESMSYSVGLRQGT